MTAMLLRELNMGKENQNQNLLTLNQEKVVLTMGSTSGSGIRFTSNILPPYLRRTKSIEELIPWLYLKGISTGDFAEALQSLLGPDAPGLSANTVVRLKTSGKTNMKNGTGAISPANATSTSGPTASTLPPGWRKSSACW